jgi:hypothetical protein
MDRLTNICWSSNQVQGAENQPKLEESPVRVAGGEHHRELPAMVTLGPDVGVTAGAHEVDTETLLREAMKKTLCIEVSSAHRTCPSSLDFQLSC